MIAIKEKSSRTGTSYRRLFAGERFFPLESTIKKKKIVDFLPPKRNPAEWHIVFEVTVRKNVATSVLKSKSEILFPKLVSQWKKDTQFISSIDEMVLHPAYQQIIGMGGEAVPLLLKELQQHPDYWFWALKSITRSDPIPEEHRGNFDAMVQAWLDWGKSKGHL